MKIANKLSPATKMVIIILYTFVLFAVSIFIINLSTFETTRENKYNYNNISKDENIQIVTKLVESRTKGNLESNKKEKSTWDLKFQIAKHNPSATVSNISLYASAETEEGEMIYFEKINQNKLDIKQAGFYTYSSLTYKSLEKSFSYKSSTKTYTPTNTQLAMVWVRVLYTVKIGEETTDKELKYYFVPSKPKQEDFNSYNEVITTSQNMKEVLVNDSNSYYTAKITPTLSSSEEVLNDKIKIKFEFDESKLLENKKYIQNAGLTLYAKIKNDPTDVENHFDDYFTVVDLSGAFVNTKNVGSWTEKETGTLNSFYESDVSIPKEYEVTELYLIVSYTTNEGVTNFDRYKIVLDIK